MRLSFRSIVKIGSFADAVVKILALAAMLFSVAVLVNVLQPGDANKQQIGADDATPPHPTGYTPDLEGTRQFLRSLPAPLIRDAGPDLFRDGADNRPILLYRALNTAHLDRFATPFVVKKQGIGDCVSWGWAHAIDIHSAVLWRLGLSDRWEPVATEAIYGGSRVEANGGRLGGYSDGSYGAAAAKFVSQFGVVFRRKYDAVDLTTYSAARAKDWGNYGCGGRDDKGRLDDVCKSHPVKSVALVATFKEAASAIRAGYPVPVCSAQGFRSTRDKDGFAAPSGKWLHCMCFIAVRFDRPGLLCLNSWGPDWIKGDKWPDDQPDGSFWVDAATVDKMLAGRDSFAVSGFIGFPFRNLNHAAWATNLDIRPLQLLPGRSETHFAQVP